MSIKSARREVWTAKSGACPIEGSGSTEREALLDLASKMEDELLSQQRRIKCLEDGEDLDIGLGTTVMKLDTHPSLNIPTLTFYETKKPGKVGRPPKEGLPKDSRTVLKLLIHKKAGAASIISLMQAAMKRASKRVARRRVQYTVEKE